MFDIGWSELLVIGVVALVVIGPKELPGVVRTIAQNIAKLRRMASDFQGQFTDAMREMELADLKKDAEKLISDATSTISDPIEQANEEVQKAVEAPAEPADEVESLVDRTGPVSDTTEKKPDGGA
jgi:sec-independent protein translocase protein TatB